MFLNAWSIALSLISLLVLFLILLAARTGYRVLRYWNPDSDRALQITLEGETWLASTLVAYGLGFQLVSLVLFVLAADDFCKVLAGAMCATGSLLANPYGMPALLVKIIGLFLYGFWLVLHRLDTRCEDYPLVRLKYSFLLVLMPWLALDIGLQTAYIANLQPDIITSCCAVVFSGSGQGATNLMTGLADPLMLIMFHGSVVLLLGLGLLFRRWRHGGLAVVSVLAWVWFLGMGVATLTTVFSSYVYAMPYHKCPFCMLKPEYHYFGFALYGTLFPAVFFGLAAPLVTPLRRHSTMALFIHSFQHWAVKTSLMLLLIFAALSSYHYLAYRLAGGEG